MKQCVKIQERVKERLLLKGVCGNGTTNQKERTKQSYYSRNQTKQSSKDRYVHIYAPSLIPKIMTFQCHQLYFYPNNSNQGIKLINTGPILPLHPPSQIPLMFLSYSPPSSLLLCFPTSFFVVIDEGHGKLINKWMVHLNFHMKISNARYIAPEVAI